MSIPGVPVGAVYALLAGVFFGAYVFLFKRHLGEYSATSITAVVYGLSFGWYASYLGLFEGTGGFGRIATTPGELVFVFGTVVFFVGGMLALYLAIERGDISYVTPISKITPIIVLPLEILLLAEYVTPLQMVGIVCTTLAVYVANYQSKSLVAPFVRVLRYRPAQLALLSAALMAVFQLSQRFVLQEIGTPLQPWILLKSGSIAVLLFPAVRRIDWSTLKSDMVFILACSLLVAIGEVFAARSFALVPASIASPLVNLQAIVAVLLGGILLREQEFVQRLVAASLAIFGVWLIAI